MTDGLSFANPALGHWLWLALAVTAVALLGLRRQRAALTRLVAPALASHLASGASTGRKLYRITCLTLAMVCMVLALARPQMGLETVQQQRTGAAIMIALDVSRSMLASDVVPNRLERAKAEINDLLTLLRGDQVGLIAFAGRASVLAPLTPDFGFIRLALDDAGPGSVSRGGTRLEEPIRKAVDGFKGVTGASRSIILITDGEDHESYAREAAAYAAERGVRILAIGLGDPAGTTVRITDPATGATRVLEDADGNPVVSRLDSQLLEELALKTDGAYIPAGTAALDLDVIYKQHIEPLTRAPMDTRERIVKRDLYQWFVLAALVFVLLGLIGQATRVSAGIAARGITTLMFGLFVCGAPVDEASAQSANPTPSAAAPAGQASAQPGAPMPAPGPTPPGAAAVDTPDAPAIAIPEDAREAYNEGLDALGKGELDAAEQLFEAARAQAGTDEAARFRATFNLAWVAMRRASNLESNEPRQALAQLRLAIERWQQALALRSEDDGARANIAVAAKRALVLEDQLAKQAEGPLRADLEALLARQQTTLGELRAADAQSDGTNLPSAQVRHLNVTALGVASELQRVLARTARDLGALGQASAQTPPSSPGAGPPGAGAHGGAAGNQPAPPTRAQLEQVLEHLARAQQLISQSRAQIRKRILTRAVRRAARALEALADAREVLFELRERIDAVYAHERAVAAGLKGLTQAPTTQASDDASDGAIGAARQQLRNAHVSNEARMVRLGQALSDAQVQAAERERQAASAAGSTPGAAPGAAAGAAASSEPDKAHLEQAYALWTAARDAMHDAGDALGRDGDATASPIDEALPALTAAVDKIQALRRHFFTVIEHLRETHEQQVALNGRTASMLGDDAAKAAGNQPGVPTADGAPDKQIDEEGQALAPEQRQLAERATGIAGGLRQMAAQASATAPGNPALPGASANPGNPATPGNAAPGTTTPPGAPDPQRFEKAAGLVDEASGQMLEAVKGLDADVRGASAASAIKKPQTRARELLAEALELLQNPDQDSSNDQQQQRDGDDDQGQNQPDEPQQAQDPSQAGSGMLQGVREREAERRERNRARARGTAPVAKDW